MRGLPFFKGKKGPQFAGMNFSNDASGGGGGGSYTLPTATASRLGGVKIGSGINVSEDGTISASGGGGGGSIEQIPLTYGMNEIPRDKTKSYFMAVGSSDASGIFYIPANKNEYCNFIGPSNVRVDSVTDTTINISSTRYSLVMITIS